MAMMKTLTGTQILTGGAYDTNIINYAPTLQLIISDGYAPNAVVANSLTNTKTSPVYETWSTSTPFDPSTPQINLSFTSNAGSTLKISHIANPATMTMALKSGNNNISFDGSFQDLGGTIWDSNGNFQNGTFSAARNYSYVDSNGTTSYLDDTVANSKTTSIDTVNIINGITNLEIKEENSSSYWSNGYFLDTQGSMITENTIVGIGATSRWIPHTEKINISSYSYWSSDFRLAFSGNGFVDYDKGFFQAELNNVIIIDNVLGSKTTSIHVNVNFTNSDNLNINIGTSKSDDIASVQSSFNKYILPYVLNSGIVVTAINPQGGILQGGSSNDTLSGGDGADTAIGGGGNDTIDGGLGVNTAVYSGKFADYVIKAAGNGAYTISDSVSGRDGTDTLTNIQNLKFFDVTKAIADIINTGGGTPAMPTLTVPASVNLSANQSVNVGNWFTPQTPKSGAAIDLWIFYETGSGVGASNGHVHVNNGYILQNNVWSVFSGDVPAQTLVAVSGADFTQTTYSAPKVVGVHDDLYAGFVSEGQWSNTAHTTIIT